MHSLPPAIRMVRLSSMTEIPLEAWHRPGPIERIEVRKVAMSKIDHLVAEIGLYGPHLLKLDTHGFELPISSGHQECST